MYVQNFTRRPEDFFTKTRLIAEFWNTVSNLPFIVIGLLRLMEQTTLPKLYILMVCAGFASALHHATTQKWMIIVDWIPIFMSLSYVIFYNLWKFVSWTSWFELFLAFSVLQADHFFHLMPVPWGHVCWHLLASVAIDSAFQSIEKNILETN